MTPLTTCQTQHKIPATRETVVAAAHAEAPTAIVTTTTKTAQTAAEIAVIAILVMTVATLKAAVTTATARRNSAPKHPLRANTLPPS